MTRNYLVLLAATATLGLSACGSEPASTPEPDSSSAPAKEMAGNASVYTALDLDKCKLVDAQTEEGASAEWECAGFGDVPLVVEEGDGRFDVDAGVKNAAFETVGAFNSLGDTVEWRLRDGKPFAIIFRYSDATEEGKGRTVLAVEKVGDVAVPGCRVAQIAGDVENANEVARELADTNVPEFVCGTSEMAVVGGAL